MLNGLSPAPSIPLCGYFSQKLTHIFYLKSDFDSFFLSQDQRLCKTQAYYNMRPLPTYLRLFQPATSTPQITHLFE
jgi:hypothetical protein